MIGRTNTGGGGVGGVLTVTAPAGVTASVSKDGKVKTKVVSADGVAVFKGLATGTWLLTITNGEQTATKYVEIATDYNTAISFNTIPDFTYTGDFEIVNDTDEPITVSQDNWKIRFLTSGTLQFITLNGADEGIDVFVVGGGGGGRSWDETYTGPAGGGGYTTTQKGVSVEVGTPYEIIIGAGGSGNTSTGINYGATSGGTTSAFGCEAEGGEGVAGGQNAGYTGADGGSGGASLSNNLPLYGGTDGADGENNDSFGAGKGQGTTTREFAEETGRLYAAGGNCLLHTNGANGEDNTGNGGDGGGSGYGGKGGSGIVVIRNKR